MPVRHEDDYQRTHIRSWDSWIDEAIVEAQERGEFDNLPHSGKPIRLEDTPFAPEMGSALRTLKNAGYSPTWMELDREITAGRQEMERFLKGSVAYLHERVAETLAPPETPETIGSAHVSWWERFCRWIDFASTVEPAPKRCLSLEDLSMIRERMRDRYLERAAGVDKKTTAFHAALPRNLWHLERLRIPPDKAAQTFDDTVPRVPGVPSF